MGFLGAQGYEDEIWLLVTPVAGQLRNHAKDDL